MPMSDSYSVITQMREREVIRKNVLSQERLRDSAGEPIRRPDRSVRDQSRIVFIRGRPPGEREELVRV
jgi:hypothetical protein